MSCSAVAMLRNARRCDGYAGKRGAKAGLSFDAQGKSTALPGGGSDWQHIATALPRAVKLRSSKDVTGRARAEFRVAKVWL